MGTCKQVIVKFEGIKKRVSIRTSGLSEEESRRNSARARIANMRTRVLALGCFIHKGLNPSDITDSYPDYTSVAHIDAKIKEYKKYADILKYRLGGLRSGHSADKTGVVIEIRDIESGDELKFEMSVGDYMERKAKITDTKDMMKAR